MSYSVFLSHSEKDKDLVSAIKNAARASGVQMYAFEDDPQPGAVLAKKILSRLIESDAVVALITKNAVESPTVQQEIGAAITHGKLVIPIFDGEVEISRFPFLAHIEYIKISQQNPAISIEKLSVRLGTLKDKKDIVALVIGLAIAALVIWMIANSQRSGVPQLAP